MTPGSSRSAVSDAIGSSASTVTGPDDSNRSRSCARRRYTVRDSPSRLALALALAAIATRTSSGTSADGRLSRDQRTQIERTMGDVATQIAAPRNTTHPQARSAVRGPAPLIFVLMPAKKSATENSTTART